MDYKTYQQRVLARASHRWYNEKVDVVDFQDVLSDFITAGNKLDLIKKGLMYGRDVDLGAGLAVDEAMFIPPEQAQRIIHAILGVATEAVEMVEALAKYLTELDKGLGADFDKTNLQEEFGDAEWYRALFLDAVGQTHEQNLEQNDAKLEKRFGNTFTEEAANNRDTDAERAALEAEHDRLEQGHA